MRLTLSHDPRRRELGIHVERALDYPPGHVPGLVAAAITEALTQLVAAGEAEPGQLVPAPRPAPDQNLLPAAPGPELGDARRRRRVLRALDEGATVEQAAARFGIDPAQVDRWDDDAAIDTRTDLLADTFGGSARREVS